MEMTVHTRRSNLQNKKTKFKCETPCCLKRQIAQQEGFKPVCPFWTYSRTSTCDHLPNVLSQRLTLKPLLNDHLLQATATTFSADSFRNFYCFQPPVSDHLTHGLTKQWSTLLKWTKRNIFFSFHYCLHIYYSPITVFLSSIYNCSINHNPWEKDSDFQVSVQEVRFLFVRRFRDISVQEVT